MLIQKLYIVFFLEAVPGNIRQAEHFVNFMRRFIEYLKVVHVSNSYDVLLFALLCKFVNNF